VAATDDDCRRAAVCRDDGHCAARDAVCVARTDADCRRSEQCRALGRCRAVEGWCVK
jgi:hypothetical protein